MSTIPSELRDTVVRRLEGAIAERDAVIADLRATSATLEAAAEELQEDTARASETIAALEQQIASAETALEEEQRDANARLDALRLAQERQNERLRHRLGEMAEAHARDVRALQEQSDDLAATRQDRDRRVRFAAEQYVTEARSILSNLSADDIERVDLVGEFQSAKHTLAEASSCASSNGSPQEAIAVAATAAASAMRVSAILHSRERRLAQFRADLVADAQWLDDAVNGVALGDWDDHQETVARLLKRERSLMSEMVERFVRQPAAALLRWNGHGAVMAKLQATTAWLAAEIATVRRHLPNAQAHEDTRYQLADPLWHALQDRFGRIMHAGHRTDGDWHDPDDPKSPYSFFFQTSQGELTVTVPWVGPLLCVRAKTAPVEVERPLDIRDGVTHIGALKARWLALDRALDNPSHSAGTINELHEGYR
jgi:hypothetical protein